MYIYIFDYIRTFYSSTKASYKHLSLFSSQVTWDLTVLGYSRYDSGDQSLPYLPGMSNVSNISLTSCCFIFSVCICLHMGLGIGEGSLDKPKDHTKWYNMVKCQLITKLKVVWDVNMTPAWWKFVQLYPGNMLWKITPTRCPCLVLDTEILLYNCSPNIYKTTSSMNPCIKMTAWKKRSSFAFRFEKGLFRAILALDPRATQILWQLWFSAYLPWVMYTWGLEVGNLYTSSTNNENFIVW